MYDSLYIAHCNNLIVEKQKFLHLVLDNEREGNQQKKIIDPGKLKNVAKESKYTFYFLQIYLVTRLC